MTRLRSSVIPEHTMASTRRHDLSANLLLGFRVWGLGFRVFVQLPSRSHPALGKEPLVSYARFHKGPLGTRSKSQVSPFSALVVGTAQYSTASECYASACQVAVPSSALCALPHVERGSTNKPILWGTSQKTTTQRCTVGIRLDAPRYRRTSLASLACAPPDRVRLALRSLM